jgi:hypothetical protein
MADLTATYMGIPLKNPIRFFDRRIYHFGLRFCASCKAGPAERL